MSRLSTVSTTPSHETREAAEVRMVTVRMEARRAAQSEAWEAILRIAGGDIDFELDDLVALEERAMAEFAKARADARAERVSIHSYCYQTKKFGAKLGES